MSRDYKVLTIAPEVFLALAVISAALGIVSAFVIFIGVGAPDTPRWMGLVTLMAGVLYCFIFLVITEIIKLLLDIKDRIK